MTVIHLAQCEDCATLVQVQGADDIPALCTRHRLVGNPHAGELPWANENP